MFLRLLQPQLHLKCAENLRRLVVFDVITGVEFPINIVTVLSHKSYQEVHGVSACCCKNQSQPSMAFASCVLVSSRSATNPRTNQIQIQEVSSLKLMRERAISNSTILIPTPAVIMQSQNPCSSF